MTFVLHRAAALLAVLGLLGGCAAPPKPAPTDQAAAAPAPAPAASSWSGRLALQVQDKPSESFTAGFDLKGDAQRGELTLQSPLGAALAVLEWKPGEATMRSGGRVRQFDSVDALVAAATGSPIPVAALFDWLRGIDTPVAGWRADLSQLGQGRVVAKRTEPQPETELRVVFER